MKPLGKAVRELAFRDWAEGEWHEPVHDGYVMACCDCGLVHRVDFSVRGRLRRQVQMRVFRDEERTDAERASRNITVEHPEPEPRRRA